MAKGSDHGHEVDLDDGRAVADAFRRGDRTVLDRVVRTYLPQVMRAALGVGLPSDRAEDVAQETFVTFVERAVAFDGRSHVRTWLFGILYRKVMESRRRARRDERFEEIDDVVEGRFDDDGRWRRPPRPVDADVLDAEIRREIEDCLERVPERGRLAFVLREVEGFSMEEICNVLAVTRTNLGVILHRTRNRLRECLEAKGMTGSRDA